MDGSLRRQCLVQKSSMSSNKSHWSFQVTEMLAVPVAEAVMVVTPAQTLKLTELTPIIGPMSL